MEYSIARSSAELDQAGDVCSRAFANYPSLVFLFPNDRNRGQLLSKFYRKLLQYSVQYGTVLVAKDNGRVVGTATYIESSQSDQTLGRMLASRLIFLPFMLPFGTTLRSLKLSRVFDRARHEFATGDDLYISYVAVAPEYQRKGICRMLMDEIFRVADSSKAKCFLETHSAQNIEMYGKYGFRPVKKCKATPFAPETTFMLRLSASQ